MDVPLASPSPPVNMLRGHVTADATTLTVHCHDRIFKQVTFVDNDGRALFRCEGQSYGSSWSWRRKVYDGTGQYLFDLRHNNIDIKNGWVVETPMKQKVCSLDFTSFWTKGPAAITATVRTQAGENVVVKTHPKDRSALTTAIRVDGISFASITKLEDNDAVRMEGRDRSVWRINVAPGVDLSLVRLHHVLLEMLLTLFRLLLFSCAGLRCYMYGGGRTWFDSYLRQWKGILSVQRPDSNDHCFRAYLVFLFFFNRTHEKKKLQFEYTTQNSIERHTLCTCSHVG